MAHHHDTPSRLEIMTHASLPMLIMLFIQMWVHYVASPPNTIFISPYLLTFLTVCALSLVVLWKGQICPGQKGRLTAILPLLAIFACGNLLYTVAWTPKHAPLLIAYLVAVILPFLYAQFPQDEGLANTVVWSGFGLCTLGVLAYGIVFWWELPSVLTWTGANNFAQLLSGVLLTGWYLMLAKSRLDGFFKLLIKLALILLVCNYLWTLLMLYVQMQQVVAFSVYMLYLLFQFGLMAVLAWLLLGKQGKNIKHPVGWSVAAFLSLLYPLINLA